MDYGDRNPADVEDEGVFYRGGRISSVLTRLKLICRPSSLGPPRGNEDRKQYYHQKGGKGLPACRHSLIAVA